MRAATTRVSSASVSIDGEVVGELPRPGLSILADVGRDDDAVAVKTLTAKIWGLWVLHDELSANDVNAPILMTSQFTLFASTRKGRRPGRSKATPGPVSELIVGVLASRLKVLSATVECDRFGADIQAALVNDGPITILIDTVARG